MREQFQDEGPGEQRGKSTWLNQKACTKATAPGKAWLHPQNQGERQDARVVRGEEAEGYEEARSPEASRSGLRA